MFKGFRLFGYYFLVFATLSCGSSRSACVETTRADSFYSFSNMSEHVRFIARCPSLSVPTAVALEPPSSPSRPCTLDVYRTISVGDTAVHRAKVVAQEQQASGSSRVPLQYENSFTVAVEKAFLVGKFLIVILFIAFFLLFWRLVSKRL